MLNIIIAGLKVCDLIKTEESLNSWDKIEQCAWRDFQKRSSEYIFIKDSQLRYISISDSFAALVRLPEEQIIGRSDYEIFASKAAENYHKSDLSVMQDGSVHEEVTEHNRENTTVCFITTKYPIKDAEGRIIGICGVARDLTARFEAGKNYEQELSFLSRLPGNAYVAALYDITDWRLIELYVKCGKLAQQLRHKTIDKLLACEAETVIEDDETKNFLKAFNREQALEVYHSGRRNIELEFLSRLTDGTKRWVRNCFCYLNNPKNGHIMLFCRMLDINEEKQKMIKLLHAAEEDSLTGLLNHESVFRHIKSFLAEEGSTGLHALFTIDIDNFKTVNDRFGHIMGDSVIMDIASMIKATFDKGDIVGRIGGDEFMILMKDAGSCYTTMRKAEELIAAMQYEVTDNGKSLQLSCSAGISLFKPGTDFEVLRKRSDTALYEAKSRGKNCFHLSEREGEEEYSAESELAEGKNLVHLRTILDKIEAAIIICDVDSELNIQVSYSSPNVFRLFGRTADEIGSDGALVLNVILPQEREGIYKAVRNTVKTGESLNYTYRVTRDEAEVEWRHIRGSLLPDRADGINRIICVITDITEFKNNEKRLRYAELRARTALDQNNVMLWEVNLAKKELFFYGHVAEQAGLAGRTFTNAPESLIDEGLVSEDTTAEFRRMFRQLYNGDDSGDFYIKARDTNGEYIPIRSGFRLIKDEQGTPCYAVGVREPRILAMELALYRTMAHGGVFSVKLDSDLTLLYANDRFFEMHEYTREEFKKKLKSKTSGYIHPADLSLVRRTLDKALHAGQPSVTLTMRIITGQGAVKYIKSTGEFQQSRDGMRLLNGVAVDVTIEKETELALLHKTEELDSFICSTPGGIFKYSADTDKFSYISDNMLKLLGYTEKEFRLKFNNCFSDMVWHEDRSKVIGEINDQIAETDYDTCKYRIEAKDGSLIWVHDEGHLVVDEDGNRWFFVVIVDITKQKEAEALLRSQKDRALESYRQAVALRSTLDSSAIWSFDFNLTKNSCSGGQKNNEAAGELQAAETVDSFFEANYKRHAESEQLKLFREIFSREALLTAFAEGREALSFEDRYFITQSEPEWVRTHIVMMKNPETEEIEAYIYANNINAAKIAEAFTEKLIDIEYELAATITVSTEKLRLLKAPAIGTICPSADNTSYSKAITAFMKSKADPLEAERCLKTAGLSHILEQLKSSPCVTCSFTVKPENEKVERKQWRWAFLDSHHTLLTFTQSDITDIYASETDSVTGISNKAGFSRAVRELLEENRDRAFCLLRADIDNFKVYNDIYGMAEGDTALATVAEELSACCSPYCCARLSGDHFAVCMPAELLDAKALRAALQNRLHTLQPDFNFFVRCGIYKITDSKMNVDIMCDRALLALRSTKGSYSCGTALYRETMRSSAFMEQKLGMSMRESLEKGEFGVYIQPQYDQMTGKIVGAEALARWFRPDGRVISPSLFIPLFEKSGFIMRFDEYIWESACRLIRKWLDEGRSVVPLSVNVSRLDIYNVNLRELLRRLLEKYGIPVSLLRLEITETAYTKDPEQVTETVRKLREDGFMIEMDDFGSGYSSLNILKDIDVDIIKLDMKFLSVTEKESRSGIILNSIMRMSSWLNIPVIAEGVETAEQAEFLKTIGCTVAQGFFYAKPMTIDEFEKKLTPDYTGTAPVLMEQCEFLAQSDFWSPNSQKTMLFNKLIGAAGIFEYKNGKAELLRVNDRFYKETAVTGMTLRDMHSLDAVSLLDESFRYGFRRRLEEAALSGEEYCFEAPLAATDSEGNAIWFQLRGRILAKGSDRNVFYCSVQNITETRRLEREERLLLAGTLEFAVFEYDGESDILSYAVKIDGQTTETVHPQFSAVAGRKAGELSADAAAELLEDFRLAVENRTGGEYHCMADFWQQGTVPVVFCFTPVAFPKDSSRVKGLIRRI